MTSAKPQDEPKGKPGPEPDRLAIPPENAEEALKRLLGVEADDGDDEKAPEGEQVPPES